MDSAGTGIIARRILVTGGAGFIGSHLVDALVKRGLEVTILDNLSSGNVGNIETHLSSRAARLVEGDVRNQNEVEEALIGVDAVFHLAAITSVPYSIDNQAITMEVNAKGTRNLLEACVVGDVKRFIYVSSCAVYGEARYLPIDEDHPLSPMSPYAESKITAEKYCKEFHDRQSLRTVTLRLFNVYGLRQPNNEYSGVITKFIENTRDGSPPIIYGDGRQTRDFVHIDDVVRSLLLSLDNNGAIGQVFNIGSGKSVTIEGLYRLISRKQGVVVQPIHKEPRPGDIRHSFANIKRAQRILGFKPLVSLDEGLGETMSNM